MLPVLPTLKCISGNQVCQWMPSLRSNNIHHYSLLKSNFYYTNPNMHLYAKQTVF